MNENKGTKKYTGADAFNDALIKAGVSHVFINSGTDYPPIIESWAKCDALGLKKPEVIISPHEYAAMSAAQGYAQISGEAQAVFVHVDVGTQNIGGAMHNAFRCRVPVFVFAGLSPYTMECELPGGRNSHIQFLQNIGDQAAIVRQYTKMSYEFRSGLNIQQMTTRAIQIAKSEPRGPVYLMATREVLEEDGKDVGADINLYQEIAPSALSGDSVEAICDALISAKKPLIITSTMGRNKDSVAELVKLAESCAVPVVEMAGSYMNFPASNKMHLGYDAHALLQDADVIVVIDCDMPWIPARKTPTPGTRVFVIDVDPLNETIPLWYAGAELFARADSFTAVKQLNAALAADDRYKKVQNADARREKIAAKHDAMRQAWKADEVQRDEITPQFLSACIREMIDDDTVLLNEAISDHGTVEKHIGREKPGTGFFSGGSSLGWFGGAAVGMKLACPEKNIVAVSGDGTYIFSCPTAVYWMAQKYNAPFLTVIYNNSGWKAPKQITLGEHPAGFAAESNSFYTSFDPPAALDMVAAAAGGAFAKTVSDPNELKSALQEGMDAVKSGRCAVINVMLPKV